ncbi:MAG TPA: hypothetical protein VHR66_31950 [Gemmataceae bacterium]|nr:hypothetical protein [Gemmataceae bacterium]
MSLPTMPPPLPQLPPPLPTALVPYREPEGPPPLPDRRDFDTPVPPPLPRNEDDRDTTPPPLPVRRGRNEFQLLHDGIEWIFGFFCLIGGLAFLAALPILQFLSLGYLLEASGRVAKSGRIRDGFPGIRRAARLGGIILASWVFVLPLRILADFTDSAQIIDPESNASTAWRFGHYLLMALIIVHITLACAMGGKLRHFISPFNLIWVLIRVFRGGYYTKLRDTLWNFTVSLRLPYVFWLGFRGFAAAFCWLVFPITWLAFSHTKAPAAPFLGFVGAVMLGLVLIYLPFLQLRMVTTNRFSQGFNVLAVRRDFRKAPWAFAFAFFVTLLFALPLYLLKIEVVPKEAAWLPGLVFISFIYPARILTGWAMGRANRRKKPRHWFFRWTGRLPFVPAAAAYVAIVFLTQYTSWNGVFSLYEQHAFLVPVPFFGM